MLVQSALHRELHRDNQVGGLLLVKIEIDVYPVIDCQVDSDVELACLFPFEIRIGYASPYHITVVRTRPAYLIARADDCLPCPVVPEFLHAVPVKSLVTVDTLVSGYAVTCPELQFAQP